MMAHEHEGEKKKKICALHDDNDYMREDDTSDYKLKDLQKIGFEEDQHANVANSYIVSSSLANCWTCNICYRKR